MAAILSSGDVLNLFAYEIKAIVFVKELIINGLNITTEVYLPPPSLGQRTISQTYLQLLHILSMIQNNRNWVQYRANHPINVSNSFADRTNETYDTYRIIKNKTLFEYQ